MTLGSPASPRAVLFDMDGVLVKSEEVWFRVVEDAGRRFRGRPVTREEFTPTFGQGTAADVEAFALRVTQTQLDAFYAEHFVRHLEAMWVNPDAAPVLDALQTRGIAVALVTNTVGPLARVILRHAQLEHRFSVWATADRATAKPAPDLLQLALEELGVAASDGWMVGDSRFDRLAAQSAGMFFVGLEQPGDTRIDSLRELIDRIDQGAPCAS